MEGFFEIQNDNDLREELLSRFSYTAENRTLRRMKNEYFVSVYNKYHRLVLKAVLDQTDDLELAQKVCQTVFLEYYSSCDALAHELVKGWLLAAVKRTLIDNHKKACVRHKAAQRTSL